jgi:hypothetical protein
MIQPDRASRRYVLKLASKRPGAGHRENVPAPRILQTAALIKIVALVYHDVPRHGKTKLETHEKPPSRVPVRHLDRWNVTPNIEA